MSDANAKAKAQASPSEKEDDDEPLRAGVPVYVPDSPSSGIAVAVGVEHTEEDDSPYGDGRFPARPGAGNEGGRSVFTFGLSAARSDFEVHGLHRNRSASISLGGFKPVNGHQLGGELEFTYGEVSFSTGLEGFNRGREYTLGLNFRYSLTPVHTALDVFVLLGARGGLTRWSYLTPLPMEDEFGDLRLVQGDWLPTAALYTGAGVTLVRTSFLQLGTSVRGGVQWWNPYTHAGLFNDLFAPVFYGQLRLDLTFNSPR